MDIEGVEYGEYSDSVYSLIIEVMKELQILSKMRKLKIKRYKRLPPEALYLFKKLEEEGCDINTLPSQDLKQALAFIFKKVDRSDEYDQELIRRIGWFETFRWRMNEKLKNDDSFYKIIQTLREHAVASRPATKSEQKARIKFKPNADYRYKQNL